MAGNRRWHRAGWHQPLALRCWEALPPAPWHHPASQRNRAALSSQQSPWPKQEMLQPPAPIREREAAGRAGPTPPTAPWIGGGQPCAILMSPHGPGTSRQGLRAAVLPFGAAAATAFPSSELTFPLCFRWPPPRHHPSIPSHRAPCSRWAAKGPRVKQHPCWGCNSPSPCSRL